MLPTSYTIVTWFTIRFGSGTSTQCRTLDVLGAWGI